MNESPPKGGKFIIGAFKVGGGSFLSPLLGGRNTSSRGGGKDAYSWD